jgi:ribosomal protein S18 acetylase RimI-like enzyme
VEGRALSDRVALRLGTRDDREFLLDLAATTFAELGDYRTTIASWLDAPEVVTIVASDGTARLGFALVAARRAIGFGRRPSAELLAIALVPAARGQGVGSLLLRRAELVARGFDADEMRLHTADSNVHAQGFFGAAGYARRRSRAMTYPNGQGALELGRALR